jgi:DNA ligase (NAD+)
LQDYAKNWIKKPGFGAKSVEKILDAIDASRNCTLNSFICALGIPLIGSSASKELIKYFNSWEEFRNAINNGYKFYNIDGFGLEMHNAIMKFDYEIADLIFSKYLKIQEITKEEISSSATLEGITVVITGKLTEYKNRSALQSDIESRGGKVVGSVSKNTDYLINNDNTSSSAKNLSAKKLNIPILTEKDFIEKFLTK